MRAAIGMLLLGLTATADPPSPPTRVGTCHVSSVKAIGQRLTDGSTGKQIPNSGSAVALADGTPGVSYDQIAAVNASSPGDPVLVCLVKLPTHCPKGDERGKWYTTTNLRTMQSWTLPDAQHMCGGA